MSTTKKIIRRALLLGSPKLLDSPEMRRGILDDIRKVKRHFTSANGGAFIEGDELRVYMRPTLLSVRKQLEWLRGADYAVIYFSGHGNSQSGKPFIALTEHESMPVFELMNLAIRQIVITDSCRNEVSQVSNFSGSGIHGLGEREWTDLPYARRIFNEIIRKTPSGQVLIQSSAYNQSSIGLANGGVFTNALLDKVADFFARDSHQLLMTDAAFKRAKRQVESNTNGKQSPSQLISPNTNELGLPLAINPFAIHRAHPELAQQFQPVAKNDNTGWWLLGFATLAVVGLGASSSSNRRK
jgi:Caspase domain